MNDDLRNASRVLILSFHFLLDDDFENLAKVDFFDLGFWYDEDLDLLLDIFCLALILP